MKVKISYKIQGIRQPLSVCGNDRRNGRDHRIYNQMYLNPQSEYSATCNVPNVEDKMHPGSGKSHLMCQ
jgi:hypothetical protein